MTKADGLKQKTPYQVVWGIKKLLLASLGFLITLVWVFILGVLVGRGDAYRFLHRWGVLVEDLAVNTELIAAAPTPASNTQSAVQPATESPPQPESATPQIQSIVTPLVANEKKPESPAPEAKKPPSPPHETAKPPVKPGNLGGKKKVKESIAAKLSFQNSLDSSHRKAKKSTKKGQPQVKVASIIPSIDKTTANAAKTKKTSKTKTDSEVKKSGNKGYQVQVGSFRKNQEAEKAVADLKKKGYQVSCETTKDSEGVRYVVRSNRLNSRVEAEKVSQKLKESRWPTCRIEEVQR